MKGAIYRLSVAIPVWVLCLSFISLPVHADVRQLFIATSYGSGWETDKIFRIPLEGENAGQLIEFAGSQEGVSYPESLTVNPTTRRLYVGNNGTHEILEFEVNADGTKGAGRVFGTFPYSFNSMAVRPSTGRLFIGVFWGVKGIYRMAADGTGYDQVVDDPPREGYPWGYFYDHCWIDFHPEDDSIIYVTTGFDNHIRIFNVNGDELGYMGSYPDSGYFLPFHFFVHAGGGQYDLIVNTIDMPGNSSRKLLKFDPDADEFYGELPNTTEPTPCATPIPGLHLDMGVVDFVQDTESQKFYSGGTDIWEIAGDYSSIVKIHDFTSSPPVQADVAISYGHSIGADTDQDGLLDDVETDTFGTNPLKADSDDDGLSDYEEIAWNGDDTEYTPYPTPTPDTDPNLADTDGDNFSDLVEVAGGSDPLDGGSTPSVVNISFGPSGSLRPDACAVDTGWTYNDDREYGWR